MKITKWFYITFGFIFITYSIMLVWGAGITFFDDVSFFERIKAYFMFFVIDEILYKLAYSLVIAFIVNYLALYLKKEKAKH